MAFKDLAKKSGRGLAVATAVLAAVSLTAAPGSAYARDWHGGHGGGGWHGGGGHWGGHHRGGGQWGGHRHVGGGAGIAVGVLGGGLAGAAIANSYGYSYPYYGGGSAYP